MPSQFGLLVEQSNESCRKRKKLQKLSTFRAVVFLGTNKESLNHGADTGRLERLLGNVP